MSNLHDPRVLLAAERTLLAWNRTSISLMAFGFVIERFGLFLEMSGKQPENVFQRHASFSVGISFVLLASFSALYSILQHKHLLRTLGPNEIPASYQVGLGMWVNGIIGALGIVLSLYLVRGVL